jgi:ribosomal protein S6--L-glutamate ligase
MKIAILSRNKNLHSIRRLLSEAKKLRVQCHIIDPLDCQLVVSSHETLIMVGPRALGEYDVILPRIGASITDYGLAVVRQFEVQGTFVINSSRAIAESRDKMRSLQILGSSGIRVPTSVLSRNLSGLKKAVNTLKGMPVVMKVLQGTQGVGVMLVHTPISLCSVWETMQGLGQDVIMQQFISEGAGRDYRAFVVGNRVVAAMMRTAAAGEFRSNIHQGGEGTLVKLPKAYEQTAIRAARILGLEIAGVDLMESHDGPLVLEVNSSPGFEGIEKATGLNMAQFILKHMLAMARQNKRQSRRKKGGWTGIERRRAVSQKKGKSKRKTKAK